MLKTSITKTHTHTKQGQNRSNVNQAAKPEFQILKDCFKSCFDTGRL